MSRNKKATASDLLYLFERPTEPVFMHKGDNNTVFNVPDEYLVDRYRPFKKDLDTRFDAQANEKIDVKKITLPNLNLPMQLGRRESFSLFVPHHRKMAARLIEIFLGMTNLDDFISSAVYCRDRINPFMFNYALSVAMINRQDTQNLAIPSPCEVFPEKYINGGFFSRAREESNILNNVSSDERIVIEIPRDYTATDLDVEHRVAYFREDLGINLHHWHWHLVYPFDAPENVVRKDRRGELFYYMHQQIMARYNFERFCNNLGRTEKFNNWREPIEEGYFPKLDSVIASRVWPPRFANSRIRDVVREAEQLKFDIQDLERWRDRIYDAIHRGTIINDRGETVELTESRGIDILGDLMEASILSANRNVYGDLHNLGHLAIAFCHDPDNRNLETFGVIGDPATAMRDPAFYKWHAFIDDVFQEHKSTLPRYTQQQLEFTGVRVTSVEVSTEGRPKNQFATFWQQSDVELTRGVDFTPRNSVLARFTHLQHTPFSYRITVENTGSNKMGTVRVFIAPRFDERGERMLFRDQKNLFVELDKFVVNLKPGRNNVTRKSTDSSVTIPFERTFRNLDASQPPDGTAQTERFNFCGCGWPQHMLIAKGTPEGYPSQLFVMVSDFNNDRAGNASGACSDAASYCGIRDSVYPDRRPMGFPFDRQPRNGVDFLDQFLTPNMLAQDVSINFMNRTVQRPAPSRPAQQGRPPTRRN